MKDYQLLNYTTWGSLFGMHLHHTPSSKQNLKPSSLWINQLITPSPWDYLRQILVVCL
jgi:hypothetical protein